MTDELLPELLMYSIAEFLMREPHWEFKLEVYSGTNLTVWSNPAPADDRNCLRFSGADLRKALASAGNRLSAAPGFQDDSTICLPPKTTIEISDTTFTLRNPVCQISFKKGGASAYIGATHVTGLQAETTFFALRAHHPEINKYREWSARVVAGVKNLYGNPSG